MKTVSFIVFLVLICFSVKIKAQNITYYTIDQIDTLQKQKPKKVMIELYSKDCEWCKKFETEVLKNPIIIDYLNQHYYTVKIEAFDKRTIRFKNRELLSTNGFHPITAEYLKGQVPLSFPTLLFFDENLTLLNFLKGYNIPKNIEIALAYFGDDAYKTKQWSEFIASFRGKIK